MQTTGARRLARDAQFETGPSPLAGMDLAQFLAQRYATSVQLENCALFGGLTAPTVPAAPSQADPSPLPPAPAPSQPWVPWTPWGPAEPGVPGYGSGTSGF